MNTNQKPPMPKTYMNVGEQLNAGIGGFVTLGRLELLAGLFHLIVRVLAWCVYPLLRYNFGTRSFGLLTIFWVGGLLSLLIGFNELASNVNRIPFLGYEYYIKILPLKLHRTWWLYLALFHYFHMWWQIKKRGVKRYSLSPGRSWMYQAVQYLPLERLASRIPQWQDWLYKLSSEHYIQKYAEPGMVAIAGWIMHGMGFGFYGTFLYCCALAMYAVILEEEKATWNMIQDQIDAELVSTMMLAENEKGVAAKTGHVMSRKRFGQMKQYHQRQQRAGVQGGFEFAGAVQTEPTANGNGQPVR
ncbi:MAG: hypothetical protein AAF632_28095 [Bacteroidota bacterium]